MAASNTPECFSEFIGKKVVGVLHGGLPVGRADIARGTHTLVFEDGRGLTFSSKGSYWIENAGDVQRAVRLVKGRLRSAEKELAAVLELAGQVAPSV